MNNNGAINNPLLTQLEVIFSTWRSQLVVPKSCSLSFFQPQNSLLCVFLITVGKISAQPSFVDYFILLIENESWVILNQGKE